LCNDGDIQGLWRCPYVKSVKIIRDRKVIKEKIVLLVLLFAVISYADAFKESKETVSKTDAVLKQTQKKIDKTDDRTIKMFEEYKEAGSEIESYRIYNSQLEDIVNSQQNEMDGLSKQIEGIDVTRRKIMPLMGKMIDVLEKFIEEDLPFLPKERSDRISRLRRDMKRSDITVSAKYIQILEAYRIEMQYGRTMEAYQGNIGKKKVNFLKIGRVGLYYMTLDAREYGVWDTKKGSWLALEDNDYAASIAKGIKIARKQSSPEFLLMAVRNAKERK
jgi:hypothetical protein